MTTAIAPALSERAIWDSQSTNVGLIEFIARLQRQDGAFESLEANLSSGRQHHEPDLFATALIAWLAGLSPSTARAPWREKAVIWLEGQQDSRGLWSFRGRGGEYPADLDDTAVSCLALLLAGRLTSREVVDRLSRFSRQSDGSFMTWEESACRRQSTDLTANLHALLALRAAGVCNENVEIASRQTFAEFVERSPYYRHGSGLSFVFARLRLSVDRPQSQVADLRRAFVRTATERQLSEIAAGCRIAEAANADEAAISASLWSAFRDARFAPLYHRRHTTTVFACDALVAAYQLSVRNSQKVI